MTAKVEADPALSLAEQVHAANSRLAAGDPEGALAILAPLTSNEGIYLPAQFLLSMTAWKMGQLDWSIDLMRQCHEAFPMEGTVAEALASLYAQAGNLQESLFMGKMATALGGAGEFVGLMPKDFPTFDHAFYTIRAKPMLAAAKANLAEGKLAAAIEKARQHVALNPEDGDARGFLAALLLDAGRASVAVDVLHAIEGHVIGGGEFPPAYASLYGRALAAVGDAAAAQTWHVKATASAPDDAEIAAAQVVDGLWLRQSPAQLAAAGEAWARRFCADERPRRWQRPKDKLVIGYLVADFVDQSDMAAIAAVARAHDRERVAVVGYGAGAQSWEANALLRGTFDAWHDVSTLDPATLARFLARGGLHLIIDAGGFAAPSGLMALARVETAIRAAWLGNAASVGQPIYDVQIAAASARVTGPTHWRVAGGYPVLPRLSRSPSGVARSGVNFGADVCLAQLDEEIVALWSSVLQAQSDAKLLLRAQDMSLGANIDRLVTRFGREIAARIDIVDAVSLEEFYGLLDVALLPRRGASARIGAEALACGVPAVAIAGNSAVEPYAPYLQDLGLSAMLVAADGQEYTSMALALAVSGQPREQVIGAMSTCAGKDGSRRFAQEIERQAMAALEFAEGTPS